ncbi:H-NS family nucleoid-associated regulatory protein [Burkholderia ubonensis]|uniref:H-NS histone family protein n=1 Tax=Burkholderia ubonensis TaxID=101571 RepID=UPI000752A7AC|nr:H-NS histone family protein [Burkholderia ubonensis]KVV07334.1 H-NS histone [Burkholderia ubonensis]
MTSTYLKLSQQMKDLAAQAEQARATEVPAVIAQIHELMSTYNLTADDLGFGGTAKTARKGRGKAASSSEKARRPPKYQNPKTGETWSGAGRAPAWIKDVKNRNRFLIEQPQ